jgi:hypothetical protein
MPATLDFPEHLPTYVQPERNRGRINIMTRTLLLLMFVMATMSDAHGRPPDQIPGSPVPPLKEPARQPVARATSVLPGINLQAPSKPVAKPTLGTINLPLPAKPQPKKPNAGKQAQQEEVPVPYATTPEEIWAAPEMIEAREVVAEFCRRSSQTSPKEGEEFLAKLKSLPTKEMRAWLVRYQRLRLHQYLEAETEKLARQLMVDHAMSRQDAVRQAAANISQQRMEANASGLPFMTHRKRQSIVIITETNYNPFEPVTDPMSPQGYKRRVAAAMSLPGDLPRGDPRNFIEGEEGVDFGEWANTPDAEPPVPPPVPTVVTPNGE